MNNEKSEMKNLEEVKLIDVIGGVRSIHVSCPHCGSANYELAPNIIDGEGNAYSGYRCRDCGKNFCIQQ